MSDKVKRSVPIQRPGNSAPPTRDQQLPESPVGVSADPSAHDPPDGAGYKSSSKVRASPVTGQRLSSSAPTLPPVSPIVHTVAGTTDGTPPAPTEMAPSLPPSAPPSAVGGSSPWSVQFNVQPSGGAGYTPGKIRGVRRVRGQRALVNAAGQPVLGDRVAEHFAIQAGPDGKPRIQALDDVGVSVGGVQLSRGQLAPLPPGSTIKVGNLPEMAVEIRGNSIAIPVEVATQAGRTNVEVSVRDVVLKVDTRDDDGRSKQLVIVDHISFDARPGELIAVMGDSGCGKSSLFSLISGYRRPTEGSVHVNGQDLHTQYAALRGLIGLVPQDDIVHPELTVREAVTYAARMRLPDVGDADRESLVDDVLDDLNLRGHELKVIGNPEKKGISGGQRKRVNIALELVADPPVLLLDEPTSGLAASDTADLVDLLQGLALGRGKTILAIIHQPSKREYEKFSRVIILGAGGRRIFDGTPLESYEFFDRYRDRRHQWRHKPEDAQRIQDPSAIFHYIKVRKEELESEGISQTVAQSQSAGVWRDEFERTFASRSREQLLTSKHDPLPALPTVGIWRSLRLLVSRYLLVKKRDRAGLAIVGLQPLLIGLILGVVFDGLKKHPVPWCQQVLTAAEQSQRCTLPPNVTRSFDVADYKVVLFLLVLAAIWCGTSNAAREIVSELPIYRRERMAGLPRSSYLLSKFVVLAGIGMLQSLLLLGLVAPWIGLGNNAPDALASMAAALVFTAWCATSLGLLLSAAFRSQVAAMAMTPIILIPQVVLGGCILPMTEKSWLSYLMDFMPSRWGFHWVLAAERQAVQSMSGWTMPTCLTQAQVVGRIDAHLVVVPHDHVWHCAEQELVSTGDGALGFAGGIGLWTEQAIWLAGAGVTFFGVAALLLWRRERRWAKGE